MKKTIMAILSILTAIFLGISASASSVVSWYVCRNKTHSQPLLDKNTAIVKNYDVYWCDENASDYNAKEKVIYLTFDAGYENGNIEKILDVLKEEDVKGTFFILNHLIKDNEALVKRMIDEGHTIGNHTASHKDMTRMSSKEEFEKELRCLSNLFYEKYGVEMAKIYRPPEGKLSEQNMIWAKELGYHTVLWSFAYYDWDNQKQPDEKTAMKKIQDNLHNGEIMLLHPTSKTNATIMRTLIQDLKKQGYRFATVEELWEK